MRGVRRLLPFFRRPTARLRCLHGRARDAPRCGRRQPLCRRAIEPRRGFWNIPAGFLENGETIEAGAAREVWEEAAASVKIERVLAIFTLVDFHHVYVHFTGELVDGAFGVGEESLETRLFSEEEIPWDDIAFISSKFALEAFFEDRRLGLTRTHVGSF